MSTERDKLERADAVEAAGGGGGGAGEASRSVRRKLLDEAGDRESVARNQVFPQKVFCALGRSLSFPSCCGDFRIGAHNFVGECADVVFSFAAVTYQYPKCTAETSAASW